MNWKSATLISLVLMLMAMGCSKEQEPKVEIVGSTTYDPNFFYIANQHCMLLENPDPTSRMLMTVEYGDELHLIERSEPMSKVMVVRTGICGYMHNDFIERKRREKKYHGDTADARYHAQRIAADKKWRSEDLPLENVTISEGWNKLILRMKDNEELSKEIAVNLAKYWLSYLKGNFKDWPDYNVYIYATHQGTKYSMVMDKNGQEVFLINQ